MTAARLDGIIASLRANGSSAPVSPHDLVTGLLLLADIRDAERALRVAVETLTDEDAARARLAALGVTP